MMGTPAFCRPWARLRGVWPPNWTMAPRTRPAAAFSVADGQARFRADRALPIHPLIVGGPLQPDEATRQALMERIDYELGRRGLALPVMPAQPPEPTPGARLRAQDANVFDIALPSS